MEQVTEELLTQFLRRDISEEGMIIAPFEDFAPGTARMDVLEWFVDQGVDVMDYMRRQNDGDFVQVPVYRGGTEIKPLWDILNADVVFLGGYVRWMCSPLLSPVPANDLDVFPINQGGYDDARAILQDAGFAIKHENEISVTYRHEEKPWSLMPSPQMIKPVDEGRVLTTGPMEEILRNFDFSIVRVGLLTLELALADPMFLDDETTKLLRWRNIHCPVSSLLRACKYAKKGYWLRPSEALRIFDDWDDRGEQYRSDIHDLFLLSVMGEISEGEVERLERLLRID